MPHWLGSNWLGSEHLVFFAQGLCITLLLSLAVIVTGTALGLVLGIARFQSRNRILLLVHSSIRNVPLLVQVLFWYFAVGSLLPEAAMVWLTTRTACGNGNNRMWAGRRLSF
ncbi:hypothetical protein ABHF33_01025 [Chitinibacter sp. FCG-7]|uniref:ABC transmembrane type-1 domain-containing protein n=1 Tax=Chitinibacter mangrovi TaxID=3153927 RepID=A0AAU7FA18_9NEIS